MKLNLNLSHLLKVHVINLSIGHKYNFGLLIFNFFKQQVHPHASLNQLPNLLICLSLQPISLLHVRKSNSIGDVAVLDLQEHGEVVAATTGESLTVSDEGMELQSRRPNRLIRLRDSSTWHVAER